MSFMHEDSRYLPLQMLPAHLILEQRMRSIKKLLQDQGQAHRLLKTCPALVCLQTGKSNRPVQQACYSSQAPVSLHWLQQLRL